MMMMMMMRRRRRMIAVTAAKTPVARTPTMAAMVTVDDFGHSAIKPLPAPFSLWTFPDTDRPSLPTDHDRYFQFNKLTGTLPKEYSALEELLYL